MKLLNNIRLLILWTLCSLNFTQARSAIELEVALKDSHGNYNLWNIWKEYDDVEIYKAGNFGDNDFTTKRTVVRFAIQADSTLLDNRGFRINFDKDGNLGASLEGQQPALGFSVVGNKLYYKGGFNWTACPIERKGSAIFSIRYSSNCRGGYRTILYVMDESPLSCSSCALYPLTLFSVLSAEVQSALGTYTQEDTAQSFQSLDTVRNSVSNDPSFSGDIQVATTTMDDSVLSTISPASLYDSTSSHSSSGSGNRDESKFLPFMVHLIHLLFL